MRRDLELARVGKNRVDEPRIIQNSIAGFSIAEEIDQLNVVGLGSGQDANHEIEIRRREARPTIRLDHREPIVSISDAARQARASRLAIRRRFL